MESFGTCDDNDDEVYDDVMLFLESVIAFLKFTYKLLCEFESPVHIKFYWNRIAFTFVICNLRCTGMS